MHFFSFPLSVSLIVHPFLYFSISSSDDAFLLFSSFCLSYCLSSISSISPFLALMMHFFSLFLFLSLLLFIHSSISPFLALMMHFFSFPLSVSLIVHPFLYFSISSSDDAFLLFSSFCLSYCSSIPLFHHF